ncbi:MAG: flagellin lysine-N-methylase [Clostridia bacterium]|nr:flagellin lysine-N-methylase [Clostridia bacterium]
MKTYVPDYYPKFRCIAGKCRHSCCIGWEIDIDEDTYDLYQSIGGGFGRRLKNNIEQGDPPHFRLCADERCPFLTSDGLCDIILTLGEDALCQICDDHPRFRNYFSDRVEMGVGLCCEAAAKLILTGEAPAGMICIDDDGEAELPLTEAETDFFEKRDSMLKTVRNSQLSPEERMTLLLEKSGKQLPDLPSSHWIGILQSLECLEPERNGILAAASDAELPVEFNRPSMNLLEYFLFRHLSGALEDDRFAERTAFAVLSCRVIRWMCAGILDKKGTLTMDDMAECARLYSSEYEYSEENTEYLLDCIGSL